MIKKCAKSLIQRYRRQCARLQGASVGKNCIFQSGVKIRKGVRGGSPGRILLGEQCTFCDGVILNAWGGSISLAEHVFIGPYTVVYGQGSISIGAHTLIAEHCSIHSSNHAITPRDQPIYTQPEVVAETVIGSDVWLGAGVRIMGGVTIGDGAVIGAGAVVTKDISPYSVAVGIPAKVIRQRK